MTLLPWSYRNGKDAAVQSAREICNQLLLETGFNVFLVKSPTGAMPPRLPLADARSDSPFAHLLEGGKSLIAQDTGKPIGPFDLPTPAQMSQIGETLNTRYVLAGRAQWKSRMVWVGISNRAKATCTVDLLLYDRGTQSLVLEARNVLGDSTESKNLYTTATSVATLNPLPLVVPGSVTPQEQHAVIAATTKALEPWLRKERLRAALAQADESGESAPSKPRFSTLLPPVTALQARLRVTEQNPKWIEAMDGDLERTFALREVQLDYSEPNKLRLTGTSPKDGAETLVENEQIRSLSIPERKKVYQKDLGATPYRRLSPLDFCGLITAGMLDYTRARYVSQDMVDGAATLVYDLSWWRVEDAPYRRIWIDPARRLVLKNELHDKIGKLKGVWLYRNPIEQSPRLWVPKRVEIVDGDHKSVASIDLSDVRVGQGEPDDQFLPAAATRRPLPIIGR